MLDSSAESVRSALKRRGGLQTGTSRRRRRPQEAVVARFVAAWESADLDALVAC